MSQTRSPVRRKSLVNDLRIHNLLAGRAIINPNSSDSAAMDNSPDATAVPHNAGFCTSDSSLCDNETIRVGVRVRPLTCQELAMASSRSRRGSAAHFLHKKGDSSDVFAWTITPAQDTIVQKSARKIQGRSVFSFDSIFDESATTQQVYRSMVQPIVDGVAAGQNGTVCCYGQTNSGKTYTMTGVLSQDDGIIQMAACDLFHCVSETSSERDYCVKVSFIEIYNEKVRDLLSTAPDETKSTSPSAMHSSSGDLKTVAVREDPRRGGVYVNCKEWQVHDASGVIDALRHGSMRRASSSTTMNDRSSRSHAIFRITVESREKVSLKGCGGTTDGVVRVSTLNLVDLAGSENGHQSATGHRQREGGKINQSLLSLSQVIHALSTPPDRRPAYINYRNSKLTRILQPYLSGNSSIAILCCITPSKLYVEETRSTLKFASRAKLVSTKPAVNELTDDAAAMIKKLQSDLEEARRDIERLERKEQLAEQNTLEAVKEFKRLKSMIWGGGELPTFQTSIPQHVEPPHVHIGQSKGLSPVKESSQALSMTSDTTGTPMWEKGSHSRSHMSSHHDENRPPTVAVSPSPLLKPPPIGKVLSCNNETLPSEVIILRESVPSPQAGHETSSVARSELVNAQRRAEFLAAKLDATEDLVESLFKDVEGARSCIYQLCHKNLSLARQIEALQGKLQQDTAFRDELMLQQYTVLKYAMYVGLLFFLFGNYDLYFAVVMFLWLCLEMVT